MKRKVTVSYRVPARVQLAEQNLATHRMSGTYCADCGDRLSLARTRPCSGAR